MMDENQADDWMQSRKNRLLPFVEVLAHRTGPPIDVLVSPTSLPSANRRRFDRIYSRLYLQHEGAEDIPGLWPSIQQHKNLCRAYSKDVHKSGRALREDWPGTMRVIMFTPQALIPSPKSPPGHCRLTPSSTSQIYCLFSRMKSLSNALSIFEVFCLDKYILIHRAFEILSWLFCMLCCWFRLQKLFFYLLNNLFTWVRRVSIAEKNKDHNNSDKRK